jgi:hypothetical protein
MLLLLGAAGLAGCVSPTGNGRTGVGTATVVFTQPEKYTDLQRSNTSVEDSRKELLPMIEQCLQKEAARTLAPGQQLTVEFLDIDQAGWIRPTGTRRVRVVSDNRPARLVFKYVLRDASGVVRKSGQETLVGVAGDAAIASTRGPEELATEERLLRDWMLRLAR